MSRSGRAAPGKTLRTLFTLILAAAAAGGCTKAGSSSGNEGSGSGGPGSATVVRVIDGDTVVVAFAGREEHLRLIGIDTPESTDPSQPAECFGAEASQRTADLLPTGTEVRLERDVEARDRYARLLAYVFRRPDDLFVNLALVEEGYAATLTIEPNVAYVDRFVGAAAHAREQGLGLWSACGPDE